MMCYRDCSSDLFSSDLSRERRDLPQRAAPDHGAPGSGHMIAAPRPGTGAATRILIAEDHVESARSLSRLLGMFGFENGRASCRASVSKSRRVITMVDVL